MKLRLEIWVRFFVVIVLVCLAVDITYVYKQRKKFQITSVESNQDHRTRNRTTTSLPNPTRPAQSENYKSEPNSESHPRAITSDELRIIENHRDILSVASSRERTITCMNKKPYAVRDEKPKEGDGSWSDPGMNFTITGLSKTLRFVQVEGVGYEISCDKVFDRQSCTYLSTGTLTENPKNPELIAITATDGSPESNFGCENSIEVWSCRNTNTSCVKIYSKPMTGNSAQWLTSNKVQFDVFDEKIDTDENSTHSLECNCSEHDCQCL